MVERHPDREELERFASDAVTPAVSRWIEEHLRSGCEVCQRLIDELLPRCDDPGLPSPSEESGEELAWDGVFANLEERLAVIAGERNAAPPLVDELLRLDRSARRAAARAPRFRNVAVCELLIERSFSVGFARAALAIELAELALELALRIPRAEYGSGVVHDLRARAWAYLGNARRLRGDLEGAGLALDTAARLVAAGTADPLEEARILDFRASLLSDRGWFEEAAALLDDVIALCDEVHDRHRKGRALISKGLFSGYAGAPEEAVTLLRRGLALIDHEVEPRLALAARHNLIGFLSDAGRCHEADRLFNLLRDTYAAFPDAWTEIRMRWLEGRIAAGLQRPLEAELAFREVRRRFITEGMGVDAALVLLDLAGLYLEHGRAGEVRALAQEMLPILLSADVHPQAANALNTLQQDMESGVLTSDGIAEIMSYLRRSRRNPLLAFRAA